MSHSCRTPTRPPAPTLPQDTPQNLHRPPRALHHLPCRNTSSVLLLPTKVCCYLSQGAPMFRNERIIAKFCLLLRAVKDLMQINQVSQDWLTVVTAFEY